MIDSPTKRACALAAVVAGLGIVSLANAQWSHNPAVNSGLVLRGSDQNQAKTLPTADGGWYLVWLDGIGTGWDTRLQRYNSHGVAQWLGNGVLVSDTAFSSTQDYGFATDAAGNAIIAYRDDGNAGNPNQIAVQKVDPKGNLLWGAGVQVSTVAGGNSPHCCATSDGGVIVAWSNPTGGASVQKLDSNGNPLWTAGGVTDTQPAGLYFVCDVASDNAGGGIVEYHHQTGGFSSPRYVKAQRFASANGAAMWNSGSPVVIFDGGSLQLGSFPSLISDGNGGIYTAWYSTGGTRSAYLQHITSAGTEVFPHNGLTVADDIANRIRVSAAMAVDQSNGDMYLIAKESDALVQGNYSLRVQRFNSAGARQWGNTGIEIVPENLVSVTFSWAQALSGGNGVIFTWDSPSSSSGNVYATRLNPNGTKAWAANNIDISSFASTKSRLWMTANAAGTRVLVTWADDRNGLNDIYGQCVNLDGTLGNPGDCNDDGNVNVADLLEVINSWGSCPAFCASDLNGDGVVNVSDLLLVIGSWG